MRKWLILGLGVGIGIGMSRLLAGKERLPLNAGEPARARYPEEEIIDAMRESEGAEMAGLYDEVSGRRGNGSGKK